MNQTLFDFDGATYQPGRDRVRLNAQLTRVMDAMAGGQWHTLHQLSQATGDPESSVSARLRDLRKARFGGHVVERNYFGNGLFAYRFIPNDAAKTM
jgi:hypothetical protein